MIQRLVMFIALTVGLTAALEGQEASGAGVPRQVRFTYSYHPVSGEKAAPVESATFSIYSDEQGGSALWSETQNVAVEANGSYTVSLGATLTNGLPSDLFGTGEPRWLGVRFNRPGEVEQKRVQLVSVPYALKAADAETLGGRPASAYLLAPTAAGTKSNTEVSAPGSPVAAVKGTQPKVTGGTQYCIGMFTNSTDLGCSAIWQSGSNIGIGTEFPLVKLDAVDTTGSGTENQFQIRASTDSSFGLLIGKNTSSAPVFYYHGPNWAHIVNVPAAPLVLGTGISARVLIDGTGNVGVGTIGPMVKMDVFDSTGSGTENQFQVRASSDSSYGLLIGKNTAGASVNVYHGPNWAHIVNVANAPLVLGTGNATRILIDGSGKVGIGNTSPAYSLDVSGDINLTGILRYQNSPVLRFQPSSPNIGLGSLALQNNTSGTSNTAVGYSALYNNTTGSYNTAVGGSAISTNNGGSYNTAVGSSALFNTTGGNNTALGYFALGNNGTGSGNIAIGYNAASNVSSGNSNNIHIGNTGSSGDNGTIRLGTPGTQTSFFVAGVNGVTTSNSAVAVLIDTTNGQLGVASSSRRYKQDINDMGEASRGLMRLRPVTFRYRKAFADGTKPIQYGLIAEEVAEVYPELVAKSADGEIETVKYQVLAPMLLNEIQRQQVEIDAEKQEIEILRQQLTDLRTAMLPMPNGNLK